jgi:hypothetical protein
MSNFSEQTSNSKKRASFWTFIKSGHINSVSLIPTFAAILLVITWIVLKAQVFPSVPQFYNYALLSVAGMIMGLVGIIYIYRREMPGPVSSVTVKGGCAVVSGVLLLLFFWILSIALFVFALSNR